MTIINLDRMQSDERETRCRVPGVEQVRRLFAKQNLHSFPAERVNEIPVEDRMTALQDLHGASDLIKETDELRKLKRKEMDILLAQPSVSISKSIPPEQQKAYNWAYQQDKDYVNKWKICFLRADQFDVEKAAIRIFRYFNSKYELFGTREILGRDIRRSDFDDNYDDKLGVDKGIFHFLPHRDRVGRAIIFINPVAAGRSMYPMGSLLRIFFWLTSIAAQENDDIQRKGFVLVWYGLYFKFDGKISECGNHYFGLFPSLPLRINSVHCCYQDPRMTFYFSFMGRTIASQYLLQFQSHMGTHLECRYNLMTFGIPPHVLPVDLQGTVSTVDYERLLAKVAKKNAVPGKGAALEALEAQQSQELDSASNPLTELQPGPLDVAMGRGSTSKRGLGYEKLKVLLERHYAEYNSVSRFEKTVISRMIYERMTDAGSRFMAKKSTKNRSPNSSEGPEWCVLGEEDARDRIAHAFRNLRQLKK